MPASSPDNSPRPRRPLRYLRKQAVVMRAHEWYCAEYSEPPPLKWLMADCGLSKSTVHDICVRCELALSQSRPRRPKPVDPKSGDPEP